MRSWISRSWIWWAVALVGMAPTAAGELIVTVTDRDGRPLPDVRLNVRGALAVAESGLRLSRTGIPGGTTDTSGRAAVRILEAGTYEIDAVPPAGYVDPEDNPFVEAPRVTFREAEERLEVTLPLWRGGPLTLEMEIEHGPERGSGKALVVGLDGDFRREVRLSDDAAEERILVPGRYEIALEPPPGLLLEDLTTSGNRLSGGRVAVEIEEGWTAQHVLWKVGASARIEGTLTYEDGPVRVMPHAVLVEPGPWAEQAAASGGWQLDRVRGRFPDRHDRERYEIFVPAGRWRVVPVGESVRAAPESVEVSLAPGGTGHADFVIREEEARGCSLRVDLTLDRESGHGLVTGSRGAAGEGEVGLWPAGEDPTKTRPLRVETTGVPGVVFFRGLDSGRYTVVGRCPGYLDASETLAVECAGDEGGRHRARLELERGPSIRFEATDEEGRPVRDAVLQAVAHDPPRRALFRPADAERFEADARTDDSGRGELAGLYPGGYRLGGRMAGRLAGQRFVRIVESATGAEEEERDVVLASHERIAVDLRVHPAASLSAVLFCDDGEKLPDRIAARAFREDAFEDSAELVLDDLTLRGRLREEVVIGPLEEDTYRVALRPHGFDRWSWVGGGQDSSGAAWIGTSLGETVDAGVVELPCAPRLRLSWSFGEEERERFDPLLAEARGSFRSRPEESRTRLAAEVERGGVLLTGLPEGEGTVHLRVEHPHFLPRGLLELDVEGRFERGTVRERSLRVPPLGGAIEVLAEAPALRVTQGEQVWIEPAPDGRALLPGLRPGRYAVALCPTVACSRTAGGEHPLTVTRGRTTVLDLRR